MDMIERWYLAHMWKFQMLILSLLSWIHCSWSQDSLWINRGMWTQIPDTVETLRLNTQSAWSEINGTLDFESDVAHSLVIINGDSLNHTWQFEWSALEPVQLEPYDTIEFQIPPLPQGTYRFGLIDEMGSVLGAKGLAQVGLYDHPRFHWNLGDWSVERLQDVGNGEPIDWEGPYEPEQFTINDRTYPSTVDDSNAFVLMNLGDTCFISIANQGFMHHVLHFHGFHVTMVSSSHHPERMGWSKDTVPIRKGEALTVMLVGYQTGEYPVHNHNLIAVTNAGFYPGGMITHILVEP